MYLDHIGTAANVVANIVMAACMILQLRLDRRTRAFRRARIRRVN